jgi:hypothetical protein
MDDTVGGKGCEVWSVYEVGVRDNLYMLNVQLHP